MESIAKREPYFDNLKLLLIFLVVLGHFCETAKTVEIAPIVKFMIYSFHMPLFIFISGLFFDSHNISKGISRGIHFFILYVLMKAVSWGINMALFQKAGFSLFNTPGMPWFMFAMAVWHILTPVILKYVNFKLFLVVSVITALLVGYDASINSMFVASRIIVFWPFFLIGTGVSRSHLLSFMKKRWVTCAGIFFLAAFVIICFLKFESVSVLSPLLSGQNPYAKLGDHAYAGILLRGFVYIVAIIIGMSVMSVIPNRRFIMTGLGARTISVYFYDQIIYVVTVFALTGLSFWQYLVLSVGVTLVFSTKVFYAPLRKVLNG